ncbi:UDP-glucose dehydrogenase family protein [Candidatus Dependentiae bacterium]
MENKRRLGIIGAGYVGLVTAVCFAKKGYEVLLVEADCEKRDIIKSGETPFFEPGLAVVLRNVLSSGKLFISDSIKSLMLENPDVVFSCVGTPSFPDGSVDLSSVWKVVDEVGYSVSSDCVFVHKSTVPVGVTRKTLEILRRLAEKRGVNFNIDVAFNPEFLREGSAVSDFNRPDRVVCGVYSKRAEDILLNLYRGFLDDSAKFLVMDFESAELTKYAANAMLATRLSFINEIACFADKVGADMSHVSRGVGSDKRIGEGFLRAGIGYGGSCLPKDVCAMVSMGKANGETMKISEAAHNVNVEQQKRFVERIVKYFGNEIKGKVAGVWGLAFKPNTDDMRDAPSISVISGLLEMGVKICAYDPHANPCKVFPKDLGIEYAQTPREVLEKSDFLAILTEWEEFLLFKPVDFALLSDRTIFDGRNCFDPRDMIANGITYFCIGRNLFVKSRAGGRIAGIPRASEGRFEL